MKRKSYPLIACVFYMLFLILIPNTFISGNFYFYCHKVTIDMILYVDTTL